MSEEDLRAEMERLRVENEALKAKLSRPTTIKVSEKGAVSVYGLGRFPVTLYKEQWLKLLDIPPDEEAGRQTFVYNVENAKAADLAAVDRAGEGLVLHPLAHGLSFERGEPVRPHQSAGGDEAREFIAGEEHLGQRRIARHAGVVGVT